MFKILNRLAWLVSIVLANMFYVLFFAYPNYGYGRYYGGGYWSDDLFTVFLVIVLFAIFIKYIFLSKHFIITNLEKIDYKYKTFKITKNDLVKDRISKEEDFVNEKSTEKKEGAEILASPPEYKDIQVPKEEESEEGLKEIDFDEFDKDFKNADLKEEIYQKQELKEGAKEEVKEKDLQKSKTISVIKKFFSENLLAKIGGILLFLGVLFLLQLVYTSIGPVGKITIGFLVSFAVFALGVVLDKKGFPKESRVLLGSSILINYLVILSGRWLIDQSFQNNEISLAINPFFSQGLTFFLLGLNTIFAVITSLAYRSHILLFFSFVSAYFNPFLINHHFEHPYTFLVYSLLLSFGAIAVAYFNKTFQKYNASLLNIAFTGGNLLFLSAPYVSNLDWIFKLFAFLILSLLVIFVAYEKAFKKMIMQYFLASYFFFFLLMFFGHLSIGSPFHNVWVLIAYGMGNFLFLIALIFSFLKFGFKTLLYLFVAPLLSIIIFFFGGVLSPGSIFYVVVAISIYYLLIYFYLFERLNVFFKQLFFLALGFFIFFVALFVKVGAHQIEVDKLQFYGIAFSSFAFLLSAYYFAGKKHLSDLYAVATLFGAFSLLLIIQRENGFFLPSVIFVILFFLLNIFAPFVFVNILQGNLKSFVLGILSSLIFVIWELYYFYFGDLGESNTIIGLWYMFLAIVYFVGAFILRLKFANFTKESEGGEPEKAPDLQSKNESLALDKTRQNNILYLFLGISISLFSLSVAYIFSKNPSIVSLIWIFESSLLFFFYSRIKNEKIYYGGLVLLFISFVKMLSVYSDVSNFQEFSFILYPVFVYLALFGGFYYLSQNKKTEIVYLVFHFLTLLVVFAMIDRIFFLSYPRLTHLPIAIFATLTLLVYLLNKYWTYFANIFLFFMMFFLLGHLMDIFDFFVYDGPGRVAYLSFYQRIVFYITSLIYCSNIFILGFFIKKDYLRKNKSALAYGIGMFIFYFFVSSSKYVYFIFNENRYILTIYWGLVSFVLLANGILKNTIRYRTIGLYILFLTLGKILLFDIWYGLSNGMTRVLALMVVGGIMIGVSMLYTKKYGGNLKGEFDLSNLKL